MSQQLEKDLEYVLPKLKPEERVDAGCVLSAIEGLLPERKSCYVEVFGTACVRRGVGGTPFQSGVKSLTAET